MFAVFIHEIPCLAASSTVLMFQTSLYSDYDKGNAATRLIYTGPDQNGYPSATKRKKNSEEKKKTTTVNAHARISFCSLPEQNVCLQPKKWE
jgi:hypothetical protein